MICKDEVRKEEDSQHEKLGSSWPFFFSVGRQGLPFSNTKWYFLGYSWTWRQTDHILVFSNNSLDFVFHDESLIIVQLFMNFVLNKKKTSWHYHLFLLQWTQIDEKVGLVRVLDLRLRSDWNFTIAEKRRLGRWWTRCGWAALTRIHPRLVSQWLTTRTENRTWRHSP